MSFYTFLPKLLNMSLTASVVVVFVLLLRLLLKRAPKVISYALWGIVLIRLLCPVSIESNFSLFGLMDAPVEERGELTSSIEYVPNNIVHTEYPTVVLPVPGVSDVINDALPKGEEQLRADPLEGPIFLATYAWIAGVLGMAIYAAVSYVRLRRKLFTAIHLRDNIWSADGITSPFVMGLFRPKIYLPNSMEQREQSYIILHEQYHIRRFDHVIKAISFVALCIHWFNPLVWVAFIMAGKDMEMSCDEAVVKKMGEGVLADYTASLLSLATGKHIIAGMPLAFGEGDTKGRIRNLANWKKPAFWVVLVAASACVVLAVCLLTNPVSGIRNPWVQEYIPGAQGILGTVDKDKFESISGDFAIGADKYGRAVFKDPYKAFDTMVELYAEGLALIQESNDLSPISRSNYSAYKTLGWQMTSGPESAQEQAAFITKFLDIYENSFEKEPPTANTEIPTTEPTPEVKEWFDDYHSDSFMWDGRREINLDAFPGVTFRWMPEKVEAIVGDEITPLYQGLPIWNVYFTDLTGDGLPELCSTTSFGSGIVDDRVIIYDYANGVSYSLIDRGFHDYTLSLQNDRLIVTKRVYNSSTVVENGYLAYVDETVQIVPIRESSIVPNDSSVVFRAKIIEIVDGYYVVEPVEDSIQASYAERIMVSMKQMDPSHEPTVGDVIEITYNGVMQEENPPIITGVQGIRVVEETSSTKDITALKLVPDKISSIEITHDFYPFEITKDLTNDEITIIKEWALALELERTPLSKEESPENYAGGESWIFNINNGEITFAYAWYGESAILINDEWYAVKNPSNPPIEIR